MAIKLNNKDYIWSYIGTILSVCSSIIMTPFVIHYLDGEMLGLWYVFQSLTAITTLFDFGFSTTFARNINYCWNGAAKLEKSGVEYAASKEPNFYLMKKAMHACKTVFFILSFAALFLMLSLGTFYIHRILPAGRSFSPYIAWFLCAAAIFLNLYYGYYNAFLRGVGAIAAVNKATVYARLAQIILTLVLLVCGFGIIGSSIAYLAYGLLFRQIGRRSFFRHKGIGEGLRKITAPFSRSETKEMFLTVWHNAWREGLVALSNYLTTQASTIICSLYMSLSETAVYSLGVMLATAVSNVASSMYVANQPVLQAAYIANDTKETKRSMSLIVTSFVVLNTLGTLALTWIGLPLLRLVKPESIVTVPIMLGISAYQLMLKFRNCYTSYFSCTNRIPYIKSFVVSSILCVAFSLVTLGVFHWGIWGLILAQIASQAVFNIWYWPIKAHQEMRLPFPTMFRLGFQEMVGLLKHS